MNPSPLADFLALPWSDKVRAGIEATVASAPRTVLVATRAQPDGPLRCLSFPRTPVPLPPGAVALYRRPRPTPQAAARATAAQVRPGEPLSRTQKALELVSQGVGPMQAAERLGISSSAVYAAIARDTKARCPCCGQRLPDRA